MASTSQTASIIQAILNNVDNSTALNATKAKVTKVNVPVITEGEIADTTYNQDTLSTVILTAINGSYELPEQTIIVEYLKNDQKLVIPGALGMNPVTTVGQPSEAPRNPLLMQRFLKATKLTYIQLKELVEQAAPYEFVRNTVDVIEATPVEAYPGTFNTAAYYLNANGTLDPPEEVAIVFAVISHALQFNCDIRDFGMLMSNGMRLTDIEWTIMKTANKARLSVKLRPFSMICLAALNLVPCNGVAIAAWVRAYGVGVGVLPKPDTKLQKEYKYTLAQPTNDAITTVSNYEKASTFEMYPVCMNLIAVFGLLHLNKDHTYRTGDSNQERICNSYLQTIRTMISPEILDSFKNNLEAVVRTAQHPFGLSQTYGIALLMGAHNVLASPLSIRVDVTPPPVQRLMIVQAAVNEWNTLPVGRLMSELYKENIDMIFVEIKKVMASPPSYSQLFALYGLAAGVKVSEESKKAADAMMPNVYGFAMSQHTDDQQKKDGIALALSLSNVARDQKSLAMTFTNLWQQYMDGVDKNGLLQFAREAKQYAKEAVAP